MTSRSLSSAALCLGLSLFLVGAGWSSQKLPADIPCMLSAIDARDAAIITAFQKYSDAVKSALRTRSSAVKSAWSQTDAQVRKGAVNAAWKAYDSMMKTNRKALSATRKDAWSRYKADAKSCRGGIDEGVGTNADNQL